MECYVYKTETTQYVGITFLLIYIDKFMLIFNKYNTINLDRINYRHTIHSRFIQFYNICIYKHIKILNNTEHIIDTLRITA